MAGPNYIIRRHHPEFGATCARCPRGLSDIPRKPPLGEVQQLTSAREDFLMSVLLRLEQGGTLLSSAAVLADGNKWQIFQAALLFEQTTGDALVQVRHSRKYSRTIRLLWTGGYTMAQVP